MHEPEQRKPWVCSKCGQTNAEWVIDCGRCYKPEQSSGNPGELSIPSKEQIHLIRETLIEDCHELLEGSLALAALDGLVAAFDDQTAELDRKSVV